MKRTLNDPKNPKKKIIGDGGWGSGGKEELSGASSDKKERIHLNWKWAPEIGAGAKVYSKNDSTLLKYFLSEWFIQEFPYLRWKGL